MRIGSMVMVRLSLRNFQESTKCDVKAAAIHVLRDFHSHMVISHRYRHLLHATIRIPERKNTRIILEMVDDSFIPEMRILRCDRQDSHGGGLPQVHR